MSHTLAWDSMNLAIYGMLAACLLPYVFSSAARAFGRFKVSDNQNPRAFLAHTTGIAARAHAAQTNSYESLPFFLASVLIAQYVVLPQYMINELVWLYVVLRILYGIAYLANLATFRSLTWALALCCPIVLMLYSARF